MLLLTYSIIIYTNHLCWYFIQFETKEFSTRQEQDGFITTTKKTPLTGFIAPQLKITQL